MTRRAVLGEYHLTEILNANISRLAQHCGLAALKLLIQKYKQCIGSLKEDQFAYIWRRNIPDGSRDVYKHGTRDVLIDAIRDLAFLIANKGPQEGQECADTLLTDNYPTVLRIGLHLCSERWGTLSDAFWRNFHKDWLARLSISKEMHELLKRNYNRFSPQERDLIITEIDQLSVPEMEDKERRTTVERHLKRDLFYSAAHGGDRGMKTRYEELASVVGSRAQDDEDVSEIAAQSNWADIPFSISDLLNFDSERLIGAFHQLGNVNSSSSPASVRSFENLLSQAARESDDGFASRLPKLLHAPALIRFAVLKGLRERWSVDNKDIPWPSLLETVQQLAMDAQPQKSGEEAMQIGEVELERVAFESSELIKHGCGERPMPREELARSADILRRLVRQLPAALARETNDPMSHALGSARARCLEALLSVAISIKRETTPEKLDDAKTLGLILDVFGDLLVRAESGLDADVSTLTSMHSPRLHYLDNVWLANCFYRIYSLVDKDAWRCAAFGFSYQAYFYDWLYRALATAGHLQRLAFDTSLPDSIRRHAYEFAALAYLNGLEELREGEVLWTLVENLDEAALSHICWFFWTQRTPSQVNAQREELIQRFWLEIERRISRTAEACANLRSALTLLTVHVTQADGPLADAIVAAAPYANAKYHTPQFIEELARLVVAQPAFVADCYRAMLQKHTPDYPPDTVFRTVTAIYAAGLTDEATAICDKIAIANPAMARRISDNFLKATDGS